MISQAIKVFFIFKASLLPVALHGQPPEGDSKALNKEIYLSSSIESIWWFFWMVDINV